MSDASREKISGTDTVSAGSGSPSLALEELAALYPYAPEKSVAILELTFGEVIASESLLERNAGARLVCFAPDEVREASARARLSPLGERVRFIRASPAGQAWSEALPAAFHLIVLSWGIEELPQSSRGALLRELASKLLAGGTLLVMSAVDSPVRLRGAYRQLLGERLGCARLPARAEDAEIPTENQLRFWLESAGLRPVDLFWKLGGWSLWVGIKPA